MTQFIVVALIVLGKLLLQWMSKREEERRAAKNRGEAGEAPPTMAPPEAPTASSGSASSRSDDPFADLTRAGEYERGKVQVTRFERTPPAPPRPPSMQPTRQPMQPTRQNPIARIEMVEDPTAVSRGRVSSGMSRRGASPELQARKAARKADQIKRQAEGKARMAARVASSRARQARGVAARAVREPKRDPELLLSPMARKLRQTFFDRETFRNAFLIGEVLGKPLTDRSPQERDR